jgi:hypothetical protein
MSEMSKSSQYGKYLWHRVSIGHRQIRQAKKNRPEGRFIAVRAD